MHRLPREVGEWRSDPERECAAEVFGRVCGPARAERVGRRIDEPVEPAEVELRGIEVQAVARPVRLDALGADRPTQAVHVDLKRGDRGPRWLGTPERVDEPVARHDRVRVQKQQREQSALLGGSEREQAVVSDYLDRSQDAEFDARSPSVSRSQAEIKRPSRWC